MRNQPQPMYTDSLPIEEWEPQDVDELNRKAERNHPLIPMADGSIRAPLGKYALMFNALGEVAPFWAPRPADMALGNFIVDSKKWSERLGLPIGAKIEGLFLQELKEDALDKNGNYRLNGRGERVQRKSGNLGRIRVLDWRPARTVEYWFEDFIRDKQREAREHRREQNILMRYSKKWLRTEGIEYKLVPSPQHRQTKGDTPVLWDVHFVISPWANMLLPRDNSLYEGISGIFTRFATLRKKEMTLEEAHNWIRKDFRERGPLLHTGPDAYKDRKDRKRKAKEKVSVRRERSALARLREINRRNEIEHPEQYFLQTTLMKMAFATKDYGWGNIGKLIGKFGATNLLVGAGLVLFGMPEVGFPVMVGKIVLQTTIDYIRTAREDYEDRKGEERDSDEDLRHQEEIRKISQSYEPDDPNGGRFDPDNQPYYSAIPSKNMHSSFGNKRDAVQAISDEQEVFSDIMGLQNRLSGSEGDPHTVGHHKVSRVSQPGGLDIEYIPDLETCYARLDQSRLGEFNLLDPKLIKYFKNMQKGQSVLRIVKDPHTGILHGEKLTYPEYLGKMRMLAKAPHQSRLELPFKGLPTPPHAYEEAKSDKQLRREFRKRSRDVDDVVTDVAVTMADKTVELMDIAKPGP